MAQSENAEERDYTAALVRGLRALPRLAGTNEAATLLTIVEIQMLCGQLAVQCDSCRAIFRCSTATPEARAAAAFSWLQPYAKHQLIPLMLEVCKEVAKTVPVLASFPARKRASMQSYIALGAKWVAFALDSLSQALQPLIGLTAQYDSFPSAAQLTRQLLDQLASEELLRALLHLFSSLTAAAPQLDPVPTDNRNLPITSGTMHGVYGMLTAGCARAVHILVADLLVALQELHGPQLGKGSSSSSNTNSSGKPPAAARPTELPARATALLTTLHNTRFLAGVCKAVLDAQLPTTTPAAAAASTTTSASTGQAPSSTNSEYQQHMQHANTHGLDADRGLSLQDAAIACSTLSDVLFLLQQAMAIALTTLRGEPLGYGAFADPGRPAPERVGKQLARVTVLVMQPEVVRFQKALLQRLFLHGGVGANGSTTAGRAGGSSSSGSGSDGGGGGGGGGAGGGKGLRAAGRAAATAVAAAASVASSSAPAAASAAAPQWALVAEEQRTGRLQWLKEQVTDREVEFQHLVWMHGSMGVWRTLRAEQPWRYMKGHPGPEVLPTPVEHATLGAAAAAAMRQLQLGKGMEGRYGSSSAAVLRTNALLPRVLTFTSNLVCENEAATWMTRQEMQQCAPVWLSAKALVLAMMADAAEGGAVGDEAAKRAAAEHNMPFGYMCTPAGENLLLVLEDIGWLLADATRGHPGAYHSLSLAQRQDAAQRLAAAALLPSLDHVLRLALRGALDGFKRRAQDGADRTAPTAPASMVLEVFAWFQGRAGACAGAPGYWGFATNSNGELQAKLRQQAVGLAVTVAKRARQMVLGPVGELAGPPPPLVPGSAQQARRRWVSQLRQGFDVLMDLSHVSACLQPELDVAMDRGLAAASVEVLEALLLCVRWGGQLGAQVLHHVAHDLAAHGSVQAQAAAGRGSRLGEEDVLLPVEASSALLVGGQLLSALAFCAACADVPWRAVAAAQGQQLVGACCEVLVVAGRMPRAAREAFAGEARRRVVAEGVGRAVAWVAWREELLPLVRGWLAPRAARLRLRQAAEGAKAERAARLAGGYATAAAAGSSSSGGGSGAGSSWGVGLIDDDALEVMAEAYPVYGTFLHFMRMTARGPDGDGGNGDDFEGAVATATGQMGNPEGFQVAASLLAGGMPPPMKAAIRAGPLQAAGGVRQSLPPAVGGVVAGYPKTRLCANPRCASFARRSEAEMELKQCGGCKAARYCGADCQRAHWREGHKEECKQLQEQQQEGLWK